LTDKKKKTHLTAAGDGFKDSCLPLLGSKFLPPDLVWGDVGKRAAVGLILLPSSEQGCAKLVVIKRSITTGSHRGQIALPGGHAEEGELTIAQTVLREIEEEIGLQPSSMKVHGILPEQRSLSGAQVMPVVITLDESSPGFCLQKSEIADLFLIPWELLQVKNSKSFQFNMFGLWRDSVLYKAEQVDIWGLTAKIISAADFS
jgi:8-oxo-dGTP pyrophosphatase MutT (NUDIX family)